MTYREKLRIEHPEKLGSYAGGCCGCPGNYWGAAPTDLTEDCLNKRRKKGRFHCSDCWDQEAPEPTECRGGYQPTERLTSEPPNCGSAAQAGAPKPTPPKRRKVVYIAGPITGVAKYWEPFEEMAEEVRAAGFIPLIPSWQPEGLTNAQYMRMCMAMLDAADAVLLLPGWKDSIGATIEATYAAYVDKPVKDSIEKLKEVLGE